MEVEDTNIVVADPNMEEQKLLLALLRRRGGTANITCFSDPLLAVKYGANNPVDALYTVADMKRLSGFELAKLLRSFSPGMRMHFIADTEQERIDAMRLMAEGCVLRPITADKLELAENAEW